MRVLWQATLLTAITSTGCMSSNARTQKKSSPTSAAENKSEAADASPGVPLMDNTLAPSATEAAETPALASDANDETSDLNPCERAKKLYEKPIFIAESQALVIKVDQDCKSSENGMEVGAAKLSAVGVSCTGGPGLVARKGHSNQNWEVINFKLDLSCAMKSSDDLRLAGKKKFGFAVDPVVRAFVPLMVDYWEFEHNNDAGLGTVPTLSERGGGAQQWNKGVQKNVSFPVKLYGRFSSWGDNASIYEAKATLVPRSNQRQFDVTVQNMKELSEEEVTLASDRCMSRTGQKSACSDAFGSN